MGRLLYHIIRWTFLVLCSPIMIPMILVMGLAYSNGSYEDYKEMISEVVKDTYKI
jgi:hypothetical protein